jgi:hypothetical protein
MPVVKFSARLDLKQKSSFMDRHYLAAQNFKSGILFFNLGSEERFPVLPGAHYRLTAYFFLYIFCCYSL